LTIKDIEGYNEKALIDALKKEFAGATVVKKPSKESPK
jgi:hypothetical protein